MTRTRRFLHGIGAGYLNQLVLATAGLWLTPFFLHSLGLAQYGLWLVATQLLVYLTLLDLGIIVVLPRNLALAVGKAKGAVDQSDVAAIIARTLPIVLMQALAGAVVAFAVIAFLPAAWQPLRDPLIAVLITFVVAFPFRICHAILLGLQDTGYVGIVQLITWALGTALTVALVFKGHGIGALAAGWIVMQAAAAIAWLVRIVTRFPEAIPARLQALRPRQALPQIAQGSWVTAGQIAQVLISGADILLIGKLLGPSYVVIYSVTGKLVTVLANQPQMLMTVALPGMAELRTSATPANLMRVASALSQAMLLISGLAFCVVVAVNHAFVSAWVGEAQYGGITLTSLIVIGMILRHLNTSVVYTIFCLGYERRITLTTLLDGIVSVAAVFILISVRGIEGAALGLIIGVTVVSLPANLSALVSANPDAAKGFFRPLAMWAMRFIPVALASVLIQWAWTPRSLIEVAALGLLVLLIYGSVMLPCLFAPPLSAYMPARLVRMRRAGNLTEAADPSR